jgi:membrane protease YdiL (CAAX protease family)
VAETSTEVSKQAVKATGTRSFLITCLTGWAVLSAAAVWYAQEKQVAPAVAVPVAAAFLIEYIFYLLPGFAQVRERVAGPALIASALLPYLIYSIPTHQFHPQAFAILATIAVLTVYWYSIFPAAWWADIALVVCLAAVLLSRLLKSIYLSPIPHVQIDILGHLMLIHTGALVILVRRRLPGINFGFIPTRHELLIGVRNFVYFIPLGALIGVALGLFKYRSRPIWQAPAILLGYFWVVALSEEFAFRGVLQQSFLAAFRSRVAALIAASLCFGLVHLWFPPGFPNWRLMALATAAGLFYGKAFEQAGGIRAAMVSHALVVMVWLTWLA